MSFGSDLHASIRRRDWLRTRPERHTEVVPVEARLFHFQCALVPCAETQRTRRAERACSRGSSSASLECQTGASRKSTCAHASIRPRPFVPRVVSCPPPRVPHSVSISRWASGSTPASESASRSVGLFRSTAASVRGQVADPRPALSFFSCGCLVWGIFEFSLSLCWLSPSRGPSRAKQAKQGQAGKQ